MVGGWRLFDLGIMGGVAASQPTFLLSLAPIQANTMEGAQSMQGIGCLDC